MTALVYRFLAHIHFSFVTRVPIVFNFLFDLFISSSNEQWTFLHDFLRILRSEAFSFTACYVIRHKVLLFALNSSLGIVCRVACLCTTRASLSRSRRPAAPWCRCRSPRGIPCFPWLRSVVFRHWEIASFIIDALSFLSINCRTKTKSSKFIDQVTSSTGKTTLPVGTSLVIPIHMLHRDERYWPEPNKVKPERFLPENIQKLDQNAFVPFSLGPMDCLGKEFSFISLNSYLIVYSQF